MLPVQNTFCFLNSPYKQQADMSKQWWNCAKWNGMIENVIYPPISNEKAQAPYFFSCAVALNTHDFNVDFFLIYCPMIIYWKYLFMIKLEINLFTEISKTLWYWNSNCNSNVVEQNELIMYHGFFFNSHKNYVWIFWVELYHFCNCYINFKVYFMLNTKLVQSLQ